MLLKNQVLLKDTVEILLLFEKMRVRPNAITMKINMVNEIVLNQSRIGIVKGAT